MLIDVKGLNIFWLLYLLFVKYFFVVVGEYIKYINSLFQGIMFRILR